MKTHIVEIFFVTLRDIAFILFKVSKLYSVRLYGLPTSQIRPEREFVRCVSLNGSFITCRMARDIAHYQTYMHMHRFLNN